MAEAQVGAERLGHLITVGLDVGDDAGVEADNLAFCLEALLRAPPFGRARPHITQHAGDVLRLSYLELDDEGAPPDSTRARVARKEVER